MHCLKGQESSNENPWVRNLFFLSYSRSSFHSYCFVLFCIVCYLWTWADCKWFGRVITISFFVCLCVFECVVFYVWLIERLNLKFVNKAGV